MRPLNWLVYTTILRLDQWRSVWHPIVLLLAIPICLMYTIPLILLGILSGALYLLPPPDDQPVVDVSHSVLWLCQTSLDPDDVFTAMKMIPDVAFPTTGLASWAVWGKLFRLVQDGLKRPSPSPAVLIYAKALTSLYFTSYTSKSRFLPFFSRIHIQDVAMLRVDVHRSDDETLLCFVLSVFQQWFNVVSGVWIVRIPEGEDIISALGPDINLDDVPEDTLEWFLHPLLHGLCGASLPWLLPINQTHPLPPRKIIVRCLHVMIAILNWQSIDLDEIKITDNSDKIATIFPHVLTLLLRSDITAAIKDDPIPNIQYPEVTRSILSRSPSSRTFSINEVLNFRAILEPLARLASEMEFKHHFQDRQLKIWSTDVL
ncbi:uncharacterized protein F5147DRAFT_773249 [Suillus discolor]|uniref:Uncharacterized protein n=1 Tax=Suillus discolor TaxID=1912936 RepID=A0A9P7JUG3_9AGAM|nr:uncharacterized protein F5147DRAFT_773249 [Suillus discolor]KAG2108913.1 hypothetical protein F5147DRAFT_773249 [Suillus discolor]